MSDPSSDPMTEADDLIATLAKHRGFLLLTADGLTEEQARTTSTVSALTIAGLLKHVADTEEGWVDFASNGADASAGSGDGQQPAEQADGAPAQGSGSDRDEAAQQADPRFILRDDETLEVLRRRVSEVAAATEQVLRTADLDASHELPPAPWFEPGTRWTVRRVALHLIAEISQHAGHADIIREAIDGQKSMG